MNNRIKSFVTELLTYGKDVSTKVSGNTNVNMTSDKTTNLRKIKKDLEETASYYKMKIKRIDNNSCEFEDNE